MLPVIKYQHELIAVPVPDGIQSPHYLELYELIFFFYVSLIKSNISTSQGSVLIIIVSSMRSSNKSDVVLAIDHT